jgi:uncharacterized membrane protein
MDDKRLETMIGQLLRAGVLAAATIVLLGGAVYLSRHCAEPVSYKTFTPGGAAIRSLGGILVSAAHFQSEALIQLGLLLLIATPVARVAIAAVGFALERDRLYTAISLIVFAILVLSLLRAT